MVAISRLRGKGSRKRRPISMGVWIVTFPYLFLIYTYVYLSNLYFFHAQTKRASFYRLGWNFGVCEKMAASARRHRQLQTSGIPDGN